MPLSDKEKEILTWVAAGKTASETGEILRVSGRTVEWYLNRIVDKLDVANRVEAVATALRRGIIPSSIVGFGVVAYGAVLACRLLHWHDIIGAPGGVG